MGRSQYYVNPARKHVTEFHDFGGGLNTTTSNDNLAPSELPSLKNMDLSSRGALQRRTGMVKHINIPTPGKGQGFFRYYKQDGTYKEIVVAGGKFFIEGVETATGDGSQVIQSDRKMEAAQFLDVLYIASGSGMIQYDGTTLDFVVPYAPKPLEALYVGTNGLADDPDNFMQDGTATFLRIDGVTFSSRYAVVNEFFTVSAFVSKPAGITVEYKFERRMKTDVDGYWLTGQNWSTDSTYTLSPSEAGDMQFRVTVRDKANPDSTEAEFLVPTYKIKPTHDPKDDEVDTANIQSCNRILLHWDRLIMYGDTIQSDAIYISDLKNPRYFPIPNSLRFDNTKKEGLTRLIRFRDNIVAFTPSTIQALYGKSPQDFQRFMLNPQVGCIAPETPAIVGNYIAFLSADGVHVLKTLGTSENRANVQRIDGRVSEEILLDSEACGLSAFNEYHIVFPSQEKRLRFYYTMNVWTRDESPKMAFSSLYYLSTEIYGQSQADGHVYRFDPTVYTDDGYIYEDELETKFLDFGAAYNPKKLKELQFMIADLDVDTQAMVHIYLDNTMVANETITISKDTAQVMDFEDLSSLLYRLRTFGKGMKIKIVVKHDEAQPFKFLSLGFIFKLKHP